MVTRAIVWIRSAAPWPGKWMCSIGWGLPRWPAKVKGLHALEDLQAIRLSLSAEVTDAYFDAIEQRSQLALLEQQIDADKDLLELTELRFEAGLTASVDVLQQSSVVGRNREPGAPHRSIAADFGKPLGCVDRAATRRGGSGGRQRSLSLRLETCHLPASPRTCCSTVRT
jgi:hypothetical protein